MYSYRRPLFTFLTACTAVVPTCGKNTTLDVFVNGLPAGPEIQECAELVLTWNQSVRPLTQVIFCS
jgi:hypothetical protein